MMLAQRLQQTIVNRMTIQNDAIRFSLMLAPNALQGSVVVAV